MPKKYIFFIVGLLLLGATGFYGYYKWQEAREKVNLWTLVPDDAVFIIETNQHTKFIRQVAQTNVWGNFTRLPYFTALNENLDLLDSATARRVTLRNFLDKKRILTSVHVTSKADFDFILYLPVSSVPEHRYVRNVVENIQKSPLFKVEEQEYQGYALMVIRNEQNGDSFAFFTYRNNIILSPKVILLQQVIRKINRARLESPAKAFAKVNYLGKRGIYANVFVNYRHLPPFLGIFFKPEIQADIDYLASLCSSSMLGFSFTQQSLLLSGISRPETLPGSLYQQVSYQSPQPLRLQAIIPDRTAVLVHFGWEQLAHLAKNTKQATLQTPSEVSPLLDSLGGTFQKELALCYLGTPTETSLPGKVIFAATEVPDITRQMFKKINQRAKEPYPALRAGRFQIQQVAVPELPAQLFGPAFKGFPQCFTAQVDSFTLFAANELVLRQVLQDIRQKKVWAGSLSQKALLAQGQAQANYSVFVNTQNAWNLLNYYVKEDKKVGFLRYEAFIKKITHLGLQFSQKANYFTTSFILQHQEETDPTDPAGNAFKLVQEVEFEDPLVTGFNLMPGEEAKNPVILVQDSLQVLHHLYADGRMNWSDSLDSKITSSIYSRRLSPNSGLNYVFATRTRIHCLDQQGADVENFPFNLSDTTVVEGLTVLEFSRQGNYHFLVNDRHGNLYLYDTQGNLLPGWEPKEMPGKLAAAPYLIKINGREVLVLILENGYAYAIDRNGLNYPGFPINLKGAISTGMVARPGNSFRKTKIVALTQAGELIYFNLSGQVEKRVAFARPTRRTTFGLIIENSGKSFLIARQDLGRVTLYNENQDLVMEKKYITSAPKIIQYFDFDPANKVYAITERGPQKTYLYDINIKLIGGRALENKLPVQLQFNPELQLYQLYKVSGKMVQLLTFRTRP